MQRYPRIRYSEINPVKRYPFTTIRHYISALHFYPVTPHSADVEEHCSLSNLKNTYHRQHDAFELSDWQYAVVIYCSCMNNHSDLRAYALTTSTTDHLRLIVNRAPVHRKAKLAQVFRVTNRPAKIALQKGNRTLLAKNERLRTKIDRNVVLLFVDWSI